MNKLIGFLLAAAALIGGAPALAQNAGEDEQAGSAWRQNPQYGPAPGTPEYYGNSGFTPPPPPWYYNGRTYAYPPQAGPAYPYADGNRRNRERDRDVVRNATRRDRDGDGVRNNRDRFPDDPRRY